MPFAATAPEARQSPSMPAPVSTLGPTPGVTWTWYPWASLPTLVLHDLLKLRSDVFIIEQACAYDDIDGRDPACEHLVGTGSPDEGPLGEGLAGQGSTGARDHETLVCLRLLPPGAKYAEASLGRLATHAATRRLGLAREAVRQGLVRLAVAYPQAGVRISGQRYLQRFYEQFGFIPVGEPYDEDGIAHQDLVLTPARVAAYRGAFLPTTA